MQCAAFTRGAKSGGNSSPGSGGCRWPARARMSSAWAGLERAARALSADQDLTPSCNASTARLISRTMNAAVVANPNSSMRRSVLQTAE